VHWQARRFSLPEVIWQLVCLNDRFALDGLSPPSYGGILWCFGWSDKPSDGQKVSEKWAHRYRTGPDGFARAKEVLLNEGAQNSEMYLTEWFPVAKKPRSENKSPPKQQIPLSHSKTILSFFSPVGTKKEQKTKIQKTAG